MTSVKQITFENETSYELQDVYTIGKHLCKDVYHTTYGQWNAIDGLVFVPNYNRYYTRGNFGGLQLRGTTVVSFGKETDKTEYENIKFMHFYRLIEIMLRVLM